MARRAFQPPYPLLLRQKHSGDLGEKPSIIANTAIWSAFQFGVARLRATLASLSSSTFNDSPQIGGKSPLRLS